MCSEPKRKANGRAITVAGTQQLKTGTDESLNSWKSHKVNPAVPASPTVLYCKSVLRIGASVAMGAALVLVPPNIDRTAYFASIFPHCS